MDYINDIFAPLLQETGFSPDPTCEKYNPMGKTWKIEPELGEGHYWAYGHKDLFDIRIHDFSYNEDKIMEFNMPRCLNIAYYESVSGKELMPYRRLSAGCVKTFCGGEPYRIMMHKKIPIRSICIELLPRYYEGFIEERYPELQFDIRNAFIQIGQTTDFPEMENLLMQVKNYMGTGIAAHLFFEGKVAEALSLIANRERQRFLKPSPSVTEHDMILIRNVTAYLDDHYALEVPLEQLSKLACMGTTKLKYTFRKYHGCTITTYIQQRRIGHAEHLLLNSDLPIGQVSKAVGYSSSSRFSELFRKSTGLLPREFRKLAK